MAERPPTWNLAGLIIWWLGERSRRFNQNLLAAVLIVVGIMLLLSLDLL